jgi:hypothetical protein
MESKIKNPSGGRIGLHPYPNHDGHPIFMYYHMMRTLLRNACVNHHFYYIDSKDENDPFKVETLIYDNQFMIPLGFQLTMWNGPHRHLNFGALLSHVEDLCSAQHANRPIPPKCGLLHHDSGNLKFPALFKYQQLSQYRRLFCSAHDAGRPKLPDSTFIQRTATHRLPSQQKHTNGNTTISFRFDNSQRDSRFSSLNKMPKHFQRRVKSKRSKLPQLINLSSSSENILDSRPPTSTSPRPSTSTWKPPSNEETSTPPTSPNSSVRPRYSPASSTRDSDSMRKSCDENKRPRSYSRSHSYSPRSKRPNKRRHLSRNKSQPQDQNLNPRSLSSESHSRSTTTLEDSNDQTSANGDRQVKFESSVSTSSKSSEFSIDTSGNEFPTIREYLGQPKARGRQTKRRLNAILNHARLQRPRTWHPPIGSLVPAREFTKRPHLIGFSSLLRRMLESQDPTMDPIAFPTFELSEDAEYLEECFKIKQKHQLVPSCRRAIYDEEALMMSIALRIRCYGNGTNWFIGAKADHGPSRVGETRTKAQRIRAVLKSKRADFMRQTGLMSRSDVETVALTFHGHLFDLGATFTDAGGIPGCPGPLMALQ